MTVRMALEDEFYTEEEVAAIWQLPAIQMIALRGTPEWPPFTYIDGNFFYRKSIADFYLYGEASAICRSAVYENRAGPQVFVAELDYDAHPALSKPGQ